MSVARAVGTVAENRENVGTVSVPYLRSGLAGEGRTLLVDWDGTGVHPSDLTRMRGSVVGRPGAVVSQQARLAAGTAGATVRMARPGLVVLSASYDPGWHVTVDGIPSTPVMVAPALVAVPVGTGTHRIVFRYVGYAGYPVLLVAVGPGPGRCLPGRAMVGPAPEACRGAVRSGTGALSPRRRGRAGAGSGAGARARTRPGCSTGRLTRPGGRPRPGAPGRATGRSTREPPAEPPAEAPAEPAAGPPAPELPAPVDPAPDATPAPVDPAETEPVLPLDPAVAPPPWPDAPVFPDDPEDPESAVTPTPFGLEPSGP